jgi:NAD(P)-dependent dehydrogenase (short-subunit alcohol dehydrogenase family)
MQDASKKVALVTGANKGIGLGTAREFGKAGMTVLLVARDTALGEAAAAKLREENLDVRFLQWDLVRPETMVAAAASIAARSSTSTFSSIMPASPIGLTGLRVPPT